MFVYLFIYLFIYLLTVPNSEESPPPTSETLNALPNQNVVMTTYLTKCVSIRLSKVLHYLKY